MPHHDLAASSAIAPGKPHSALWRVVFLAGLLLTSGCAAEPAGDEASLDTLRARMVKEQLQARDISDQRVLAAMGKVPRHEFVPDESRTSAYQDRPLSIGQGQTISQPYMVALMTQLAAPQPGQRVLEVGTGSGYQAAVLAELRAEVYTIELLGELAEEAKARLQRLGYGVEPADADSAPKMDEEKRGRIRVKTGDGYLGWKEAAPFDAIVVTCGAEHVPEPLFEQLRPGGRMVIPVGRPLGDQVLKVITKGAKGERQERDVIPVRFVPLRRPAKT